MENKDLITKVAEAPARALEGAIVGSEHAARGIFNKSDVRIAEGYWHALGPGLTTGASDDDPSGIATYSQAGAQFGFQFLWLALFTFPLMAVIQEMCARIGLATGRGLAGNIRRQYSVKVLYVLAILLLVANAFNLGADLGAVSSGFQLIMPQAPFVVVIAAFTIISLGLQIFVSYSRYAKYLKYLSFVLLLYIITAFTITGLPWDEIVHKTLVPHMLFTKDGWILVCAILGTTISPYLFFWQTSQEVEERQVNSKIKARLRHESLHKSEVRSMRFDVWSGMLLSNVVMFFIIVTCAATLFPAGITNISSAAEAAAALKPLAGNQAYTLFALGIIGTGLLAIPVLSGSSAYAFAETARWKEGLNRKLHDAYGFYGIIIIAMLLGLIMNFFGLNPIKALIYSAVLNGMVAPIVLYFIVKLASDKGVMGRWKNRSLTTAIGWLVVILMALSGLGAVYALLF